MFVVAAAAALHSSIAPLQLYMCGEAFDVPLTVICSRTFGFSLKECVEFRIFWSHKSRAQKFSFGELWLLYSFYAVISTGYHKLWKEMAKSIWNGTHCRSLSQSQFMFDRCDDSTSGHKVTQICWWFPSHHVQNPIQTNFKMTTNVHYPNDRLFEPKERKI